MTNTLPLSNIWTASEAIHVDFHASRNPDGVMFRPGKVTGIPRLCRAVGHRLPSGISDDSTTEWEVRIVRQTAVNEVD
jgi:hypothetical protein